MIQHMTKQSHTPGPWLFDQAGERLISLGEMGGETGGNTIICRYFSPDKKGDARLIAAAPDLLEALTLLSRMCKGLDWCDTEESARRNQLVDAAIAKARGKV